MYFLKCTCNLNSDMTPAFRAAASSGHVHVLDNNFALCSAAWNGHVNVLEHLHRKWLLNADDARCDDNYALQKAAP